MTRTTRSHEALYSKPRKVRKRRRCDGHLADPHWIEAGQEAIYSALPPGGELGYERWQHAVFCLDCAPADTVPDAH